MSPPNHSILILVHHRLLGEILRFRLELLGWHAIVAHDEPELEEAIASTVPHLLIIDLDILTCDPLLVIERLSSDEVLHRIPIMCMSADGDMDRAEKAYRAGAREYLLIPFDPITLERKVEKLVARFMESSTAVIEEPGDRFELVGQ
ncbi:MAG: response regulator [Pirellulaceae bacterium]|nr:MAG: response regulator [Pirellulaceae bacterium]